MPRMTTAEPVIESLLAHGIDALFALPGVHNDHLFDAAHKASDGIRVIHPRHEQTAAYMALGAALAGQIPSFAIEQGHGYLHEIHDQIGLPRHIAKQGERIRSPQEASVRVAQGIDVATSGRTGPVALECAIDTRGQEAEVSLTPPIVHSPPCADPACGAWFGGTAAFAIRQKEALA
jgi:acetolactate synthase-1/2/3 large subunit